MLQLTPTQRDIYLEGKLFGGAVNNIGGCQKYLCELDVERFARARQLLLEGNDAYRLRFRELTGGCEPLLGEHVPGPMPVYDYSTCSDARLAAMAWIQGRFQAAFADLSDTLFEDALIRITEREYWYFAKAHHLIMDGWGFALQMQRCLELYAQLAQADAVGSAGPSFASYMREQAGYVDSSAYALSREYWLSQFEVLPQPFLAARSAPRAEQPAGSSRVSTTVDAALFHDLNELARRSGANIASVFQSALYVYFSRVYGCDDLVICSPVHNRRTAVEKATIGSLVNVNATRLVARANTGFSELVRDTAQLQKKNHRHSRFPMGDLVRALRKRHPSWTGHLHQLAFNYQKLDFELTVEGHAVQTQYLTHDREQVPLTFVACEYGAGQDVAFHLDYRTDYFDHTQATAILERVLGLLQQVVDGEDQAISRLQLPTAGEVDRLLGEWSGSRVPLRRDVCLHQFFEEQAARSPDAIAVTCGEQSLTYRELDTRADAVARGLDALGVGPDQFVGICHSRTPNLLVAILGILKSGAAYVPIDPAYPAARIEYILDDAQVGVVLTDPLGGNVLPAGAYCAIDVEALLDGEVAAVPARLGQGKSELSDSNLAYVIYTSGSSGRPKGVLIEHRNAAAFVQWALETFSNDDLAAVLAATSICFDLSVFEMFVPLAMGGRVMLADNVLVLRDAGITSITLINTVPSAIRSLLEAGAIPRSVRCINLAGELLRQDLVDALCELPDVRINDLYGPSEDTTYSTWCRRYKHGHETIGRPISNTQVYVLDDQGGLLPPGSVGELHIAGAGLARGYLNQPVLTDEKFVLNQNIGNRVYRTGDLVRFDEDGQLRYCGRKDNQVKIRGYRIELGEIEARLVQHPAVDDCAVIVRSDVGAASDSVIVGYLATGIEASEDGAAERELVDSVVAHLSRTLPTYMVPSLFVHLRALPLTPNGKVDRKALPAPGRRAFQSGSSTEPRNDLEQGVYRLWTELLDTDDIGVSDSFFARGGNSLLLMRLASAIEAEFKLGLDLSELFAHTTIESQAALIEHKQGLAKMLDAIRAPADEASSHYITL